MAASWDDLPEPRNVHLRSDDVEEPPETPAWEQEDAPTITTFEGQLDRQPALVICWGVNSEAFLVCNATVSLEEAR